MREFGPFIVLTVALAYGEMNGYLSQWMLRQLLFLPLVTSPVASPLFDMDARWLILTACSSFVCQLTAIALNWTLLGGLCLIFYMDPAPGSTSILFLPLSGITVLCMSNTYGRTFLFLGIPGLYCIWFVLSEFFRVIR